jgi:hypothetical protein
MQHLRTLIIAISCVNCPLALSAEIHDATRSGDLESFKSMIESGSDVNVHTRSVFNGRKWPTSGVPTVLFYLFFLVELSLSVPASTGAPRT